MMTRKEIASDFLKRCSKGDSFEAFKLYVGLGFKHHNVWFKGDADTLKQAMKEAAQLNPSKIFQIRHILEDGDLVATHSHVRQDNDDSGSGVVHIFKFEGDKIIELWDLGQPVPDDSPNENGMF